MKAHKTFNLMLVFIFVFSLLGMPLPVRTQEPTLNHRVTVILDYHHGAPWILGEEWPLGALVTINIDDPSTPESPDFTTQIYAGNVYPEQVGGGFNLSPDHSISPGFIVTVSDGIVTQSLEVSDIQSISIDGQNDQVAGSTSPNRELSVIANNVIVQTRSDDVGNWLGNFAGKTDLSWDSSIGIKIFDDNGNFTEWHMTDPNTPIIIAGPNQPNQGFVLGRNWPSGLLVHMTVERSGSVVYASDAIVGPCGAGNPAYPGCGPDQVYFDLGYSDTGALRFYLEPGDMIILTGGEIIRSMIVPALLVTDVDISTSTITGTADASMDVLVTACPGTDTRFMVTPDAAGHWTTIAPFDLVLGMGCAVMQTDEYGNITWNPWAVPELRIEADVMSQWIQAHERNYPPISIWSLGSLLTLTIDDPANGVGVDYTGIGVMEHNPDNPGDPNDIRANFDWPAIRLQPGFIVTVSGNDTTKTLILSSLHVNNFDAQADTISGIASPDANVEVCANIPNNCVRRHVTADSSGSWLADYHNPGTQLDEQQTVDLKADSNGWAEESDTDGDITHADWYIPSPMFVVRVNYDEIDAQQWDMGDTLTVSIDTPTTADNPDYTATKTVTGFSPRDPSQTYAPFYFSGIYDIRAGDMISVSNGLITKTTVVTNLAFSEVNLASAKVYGNAEPNQIINTWTCQQNTCVGRDETADVDGHWVTNFSIPGEKDWEQGTMDFQPGSWIGSWMGDEDGDGTMFDWYVPMNQSPQINLFNAPLAPVQLGQSISAAVEFNDPDIDDTHTATWDWGDGSTTTTPATVPSVTTSHTYASSGVYTVTATITDAVGESDTETFQYVVIYDPDGGFVTGGGWINSPAGAYTPNPALTGKATIGFVSKYQKGANIPTGNTEFQFHVTNMTFKSTSYDWLVVAGTKAQYKGIGTINGAGEYKFLLTAIDGTPDRFRIKIWDDEHVIYDNQLGAADTDDPTTVIQGGFIVIHKAK